MKESDFWNKIRKEVGTKYYAKRIESKLESGIPDVLAVDIWNKPFFIELKVAHVITKLPKSKNSRRVKISIRTSQYLWFRTYPAAAYMAICVVDDLFGVYYAIVSKKSVQHIKNGMTVSEFNLITINAYKKINTIEELVKILFA